MCIRDSHVRHHFHAERRQKLARHAGRGHPGRCLPGARALQDVAAVIGVRAQGAHQVGMPRPRRHLAHQIARRLAEGGHAIRPVLPIAVGHLKRNGTADGATEADAARDAHRVLLDGHAAAAPVASLAAGQIGVDVIDGHGQAGRHARHDGCKTRPVTFSGSDVFHRRSFLAGRADRGRPRQIGTHCSCLLYTSKCDAARQKQGGAQRQRSLGESGGRAFRRFSRRRKTVLSASDAFGRRRSL